MLRRLGGLGIEVNVVKNVVLSTGFVILLDAFDMLRVIES